MNVRVKINGIVKELSVGANETLLAALRREGYYSVKHGCETGECGACGVLMKCKNDAAPSMANTCVMLAAQADSAEITTVESLGKRNEVSVLQQSFMENGAIQCGYCTPAQMLAAKALLDKNPSPNETDVREAIGGVLCRCTGYVKPVQAVLNAAAKLRGDSSEMHPFFKRVIAPDGGDAPPSAGQFRQDIGDAAWGGTGDDRRPATDDRSTQSGKPSNLQTEKQSDVQTDTKPNPLKQFVLAPEDQTKVVGKPEIKVDAAKLVQGKPAFVDDAPLPGMLYAAMKTSPHAHARIKDINTEKAEALPGVHAVLTYKNVKRVIYASGGQSYPNPPPYDQVSLDNKVRHVGDRVAVVAAETYAIAKMACELIEVDYDVLPAVFDPDEAMREGAPIIHDEQDAIGIKDPKRNIVCKPYALVGDIEKGFAESEVIIEREYRVPQQQQASIEAHICMTWFDEDDRMVIRTSTQVPFHVRRMVAPLIGLPVKKIRVIKPRVGGGFGGKQEMLIEDLCAHLTMATGRPVRFEYSRAEEFTSARSRHPQRIVFKAGFKKDGTLHALRQYVLGNTGAYGTHGLTVQTVSGLRGLSTYNCPHREFVCDVVYTNMPTPGAFRGYGAPQAEFALECLMDEAADVLGFDNIELRRKNWVRVGDALPLAKALGEAREGFDQIIKTNALEECFQQGMAAVSWQQRAEFAGKDLVVDPARPHIRRGLGCAAAMHGTAIAGLDMGAASVKMNDDGSFNVLVGGTDIGTGSDTVIGQIAAETLGVPLEDVIVYSSDTDFTPFDTGAYASSTTFITGGATKKAAEQVRDQIKSVALHMFKAGYGDVGGRLAIAVVQQKDEDVHKVPKVDNVQNVTNLRNLSSEDLILSDRRVHAPDGRTLTMEQIALYATHQDNQHQIMATASHMSYDSPPPFAAQFADVEVDIETGQVTVKRLVMAVDCGVAINPATASGQIEGGNLQACGYGHCEEMRYDDKGAVVNTRLGQYRIYSAEESPQLESILVQTYEPSGPYGAKAVAEIPMDGVGPAIANAVYHATGKRFYQIPLTPERVWQGLA